MTVWNVDVITTWRAHEPPTGTLRRQNSQTKNLTSTCTCFLGEWANVNTSGGAATAYLRKDICPSPFFQSVPHTASIGNGSWSREHKCDQIVKGIREGDQRSQRTRNRIVISNSLCVDDKHKVGLFLICSRVICTKVYKVPTSKWRNCKAIQEDRTYWKDIDCAITS